MLGCTFSNCIAIFRDTQHSMFRYLNPISFGVIRGNVLYCLFSFYFRLWIFSSKISAGSSLSSCSKSFPWTASCSISSLNFCTPFGALAMTSKLSKKVSGFMRFSWKAPLSSSCHSEAFGFLQSPQAACGTQLKSSSGSRCGLFSRLGFFISRLYPPALISSIETFQARSFFSRLCHHDFSGSNSSMRIGFGLIVGFYPVRIGMLVKPYLFCRCAFCWKKSRFVLMPVYGLNTPLGRRTIVCRFALFK